MKIEVLYEDNDILVAVKPYGLPSQPDKKNSENMVSMLKLRIFEKEHRTEEPYLAPITDWIDRLAALCYLQRIKKLRQNCLNRAKMVRWSNIIRRS